MDDVFHMASYMLVAFKSGVKKDSAYLHCGTKKVLGNGSSFGLFT